ncbi:hypothetical protein SK128_023463, partial [Halocaridina rubra]
KPYCKAPSLHNVSVLYGKLRTPNGPHEGSYGRKTLPLPSLSVSSFTEDEFENALAYSHGRKTLLLLPLPLSCSLKEFGKQAPVNAAF